jgi:hypothetical protein
MSAWAASAAASNDHVAPVGVSLPPYVPLKGRR